MPAAPASNPRVRFPESRSAVLLALAAALAASLLLGFFQVEDADVFWHLKAGQVSLERGAILDTNLFSSTFPDHPWTNSEWLFQIALAGAFQAGGWGGVAAFKLLLVGAIAAALFFAMTAAGGGAPEAAALTVAALSIVRARLTERPQLVSGLIFCLVLLALARRARGSGASVWWLPTLFALWGNLHAEVAIGLLFLGARVAGEALDRRLAGQSLLQRGDRLPLAFLLCVPLAAANPFTWRTPAFPFLHVNLGTVVDVLEFRSSFGAPVPLFWATLALTAAVVIRGRREIGLGAALPLATTAILAVCWLRAIPYFLFAAAPLLHARALAATRGSQGSAARLRAGMLALVSAALLVWCLFFDNPRLFRWGSGVNEELFPVAAANLLAREQFPPSLFNDYNEGGYLLFRLWPHLPVFQDGRCLQAYPADFLTQLNAGSPPRGWQALLAERRVNTALVRRHHLEEREFTRAAWGMVYWDDFWAILVRRESAGAALLERLEFRRYLPGVDVSRVDPAGLPALVEEMRRNQRDRTPPSPHVAGDLGVTLAELDRLPEAIEALEQQVRLAPTFGPGWVNLGLVRLRAGERRRGELALRRALEIDPSLEPAREGLRAVGAQPP